MNPSVQVIAADPKEAPSTLAFKREHKLLDFNRMPHNVWGGATFGIPLEKLNLDLDVIDDVQLVSLDERESACKALFHLEGRAVGRSSCCAFAAAQQIAQKVANKKILICFYDSSWKYESSNGDFK